MARLALELGGFDKVGKLTLFQVEMLLEEIVAKRDEASSPLSTMYGGEGHDVAEGEAKKFTSFSDAFKKEYRY